KVQESSRNGYCNYRKYHMFLGRCTWRNQFLLVGRFALKFYLLRQYTGFKERDILRTRKTNYNPKEILEMTTQETQKLEILSIETKPEHDPYVNIDGIVSRTYLKLDP